MIKFEKDWEDYPDAIIHQKTPNVSFLHLAEIYDKMGIKNCDFHLTLLNPDLADIDPYDPDLTRTEKIMVLDECVNNFWYYLREVLILPLQGSSKGIHFKANRSNIGLFWLYFNHITVINTVIRQTGKTTNLVALIQWLLNFAVKKYTVGMITKNSRLQRETMSEIKSQFNQLPPYLDMRSRGDIFNSDIAHLSGADNKLVCELGNASPDDADKVMRGFRIATLLVDEIAFVNNIAIALGAASMAGNKAKEVAAELGNPYGNIYVTTAGDIDSRDGNYVYEMLNNACVYNEKLLDCEDLETLKKYIITNSSARDRKDAKMMVNLTMTYRQMGYDDDWMKRKLEEVDSSDENIERDLFNKWISGSSASPLTSENKEDLQNGKVEDPEVRYVEPFSYAMRWYVSERELARILDAGGNMIIGSDTSSGSGSDDISFYIRNSLNGETLAGMLFNTISIYELSDFYSDFLINNPQSTLVIERKDSGPAIIDAIIERLCAAGINPLTRVFNNIVQNKDQYEKEYKELMTCRISDKQKFINHKKHFGFTTTGQGEYARSMLFGRNMQSNLKYTAHTTRDVPLINQYMGLIIKNGRIDHQVGGHDDAVVAHLLSYWFLTMGKNLQVYGINPSSVLRTNDVYIDDKYKAVKDDYDKHELEEREEEKSRLIEAIKNCDNDLVARQMAKRVAFLHRDIKRDNNQISYEEYTESILNERRMNMVRR